MPSHQHFTSKDFVTLVKATSYWIAYRAALGKSQFISERSLAHPIGDILSASFPSWRAVPESNHPILNSRQGRGRPSQIDYVLKQNESLKLVLETKWAPTTPGAVLEDLARIASIKSDGAIARKLFRGFLLCGKRPDFDRVFSQRLNSEGSRIEHLPAFLAVDDRGKCDISIKSLEDAQWTVWQEACERAEVPAESITTRLCHVSSLGGFKVAGWQVEIRPGRKSANARTAG